ncbi:non-ribosomal peptide synthetase, partial [Paenibacillus terrae]|uniref:non-ribosomal peptide synthetase n=1 Tax=Paenibacillus terrae TaxID=159743 RepID=UPI000AA61E40
MINKLDKMNVDDIWSLSPTQEGILYHSLMSNEEDPYLVQLKLRLVGEINSDLIEQAWQQLPQKHEALRSVFRYKGIEKPVQIVLKNKTIPIRKYNFANLEDEQSRSEMIDIVMSQDSVEKIDITCDPVRVTLCTFGTNACEMIITHHHILYDGWSSGIVIGSFLEQYEALLMGTSIPISNHVGYKSFIRWTKSLDRQEQSDYWKKNLDALDSRSMLKIPKDISSVYKKGSGEWVLTLDSEYYAEVQSFIRAHEMTLASFLYSAWGILLHKYTRSCDLVFGTTVSGRNLDIDGIENTIGLFINTLPLRLKWDGNQNIIHWIRTVEELLRSRMEYEQTPLINIHEYSGLGTGEPLFNTIFVVENYPLDERLRQHTGRVKIISYESIERTHYDLTLTAFLDESLRLRFTYLQDKITLEQIQGLGKHLFKIMKHMMRNPGLALNDVQMLDLNEVEHLMELSVSTPTKYPSELGIHTRFENRFCHADNPHDKTIVSWFEEQVARTPEAVAVVCGNEHLTYRELNAKANQLARVLRERGIGADSLVGIMAERSVEMVVGILAILKAGGAYLPIEPSYPTERIAYMLEDSGADLLLVYGEPKVPQVYEGTVLNLADASLYAGETSNLPAASGPENLAYVIYTSGSTGQPKGVAVVHRGVVRLVKETDYVRITESDVFLQASTVSFDAATFEIWGSLLNGARLVLMPPVLTTLEELSEQIGTYGITILWLTSGLFNVMVEHRLHGLKGVRQLLVGGDVVSVPHAKKAMQIEGLQLINGYGPTESTTFACCYPIGEADVNRGTIPIGRPIANTRAYIVDRENMLLPIGVPGELCIAGDGLARGYLNRPELTAEKFVSNPFEPGERMYRTGDLARWLPDGNIEYLGRIDHQVKIRGYRIECGEVEVRLLEHEAVREAVVMAKRDESGQAYLCAYYVSSEARSVAELRAHLAALLPEYMIPAYFVHLHQMPLTPNGKIDRNALPEPDVQLAAGAAYEAPRSDIESQLVEIWQGVLSVEHIGIHDHFFALGGDSIKAIQVASRLHKYDLQLEMRDLFRYPTIHDLAPHVQSVARHADQGLVAGEVPLLPVQHCFFEQQMEHPHRFNQSMMLYRKEGFDEAI